MSTLKRILSYTKLYWKRLTISGTAAIFYGIFSAAPTYLVQHIIDNVFVARHVHLLMPFIVLFISLFILKGIFMYLSNYYMHWVGTHVVNDIRYDLFKKIIYFPTSFYQNKTTGQLISYFLNDIGAIQNATSTAIRNGIRTFFEASFLLLVACKQNLQVAILLITVGPIVGITIQKMGKKMRSTAKTSQQAMGNISSVLQEMFIGLREIKSFNTEQTEVNRLSESLKKFFGSTMKNVRAISITPALIEIIAMSGCGIIFYIAAKQVLNGSITAGQLASFATATLLAYQPIKRIVNVYAEVQTGIAAAGRVFEIMDLNYHANQNREIILDKFNNLIEFKNFSFNYDSKYPIFENMDLKIKKGESIGLIGPSGCGKSTFSDLILGFIQGKSETLFLDDKDITKIAFSSLRKQVGYVGQKTFLFNDTIKANVKYANPETSDEEMINACKTAHAHDFISNLQNGYDTIVGEDGTLLSGGQKQRITIARALLKNPEILIFDEATSALDHESEETIRKALEEICKYKTVIIISHRLSLVEKMDRILTIKEHKIVEISKELLSQKPNFASVHNLE
ncbi:ABC transporter ATP-binding protein [Candidatus Babeliales bacterium]|nr:ABC transporter ATP-binding protein [Candidatus Babeliales bacterium]